MSEKFPGQFNIQSFVEDCSQNPDGEIRYVTQEVKLPDKSDWVVNINSVVWSEGDNLESTHNFYMNDTDEDGGYNHFELRNYDRAYTLKRSDGSIVFAKGSENPAMKRTETWLSDLLRNF
ncbi:hypothetical protein [Gracilimonas sediminicola]|uniref:Uncharacterized protein n=1 Tax=Gracilimonas sediminicola TaxID=2952158 RepID=A0A9X2L4Q7_9BACT|nr:hypothetical protein [Gracilimonas sediminicola]MCP9292254.1 hypothetical protein [Gracilimonas sediminicola]